MAPVALSGFAEGRLAVREVVETVVSAKETV